MSKKTSKELRVLYQKAQDYKSQIRSKLTSVMNYTQEFGTINDNDDDQSMVTRSVDPVVSDSVDSIQNFIMSTVFGVRTAWAKFGVNKALLEEHFKGATAEKKKQEFEGILKEATDTVFDFLLDSNYYAEITSAVRDCCNLGTGCYKVIPMKSTVMPFTYKYQGLNNLFLMEDVFGNPNYIFQVHHNKCADDINDEYGDVKLPATVTAGDRKRKVNLIEVVIPIFDEDSGNTKFHYALFTEGFSHELFYKELEYNPYKVFRFSKIQGNPWGRGIGMIALDSFSRLEYYKKMRARQVKKIVDPSTGFIGDKQLMFALSLEAGSKNYLGDGVNKNVDVRNIGVTGELMPIDIDIETEKQAIRDLYLNKPFGDFEDQKGAKSTVEIQKRFDLFRQRYAGTAELFYTELLKPTFHAPFMILLQNKQVTLPAEIINYTNLRYMNQLTKASQMDEVEQIVNYMMIVMQSFPNYARFVFKPESVLWDIATKMDIDTRLLNDKDTISQMYQQEMAQQQAMAMAQLGQAQQGGVNEESTNPVEEAIIGG